MKWQPVHVLSYLLPATLLHYSFLVAYNLLSFAGLIKPITQSVGRLESLIYVSFYLLFVFGFATIAFRSKWSRSMRWVIEMGSQRGMRIGGVPVVDILVIIVIVVGGLLLANQGPEMVSATNTQLGANTTATRDRELELPSVTPLLVSYLFGPMVVALVTACIADRPRLLDYVIVNDPPLTFADYAKQEGIDEKVLAEENGFDPQNLPGLQFGQRLKLPPR